MLVFNHLFFLFEVAHNLLETLFKYLNLFLVLLSPFLLQLLAPDVLLLCAAVNVDISFEVFIHLFQVSNLSLVIVDRIPLSDRFLSQLRIFKVDVFLNLLDVYKCYNLHKITYFSGHRFAPSV